LAKVGEVEVSCHADITPCHISADGIWLDEFLVYAPPVDVNILSSKSVYGYTDCTYCPSMYIVGSGISPMSIVPTRIPTSPPPSHSYHIFSLVDAIVVGATSVGTTCISTRVSERLFCISFA
jgi:hypothetical protein